MDFLPDQESLAYWLNHYGSFAIFFLLALGIIAMPIPDETLLVLAGIFIKKEHVHLIPTILAAYAGALTGITVSYLLGKTLGVRLIHKYGPYVGITPERLQKTHDWFEHYGKWALTFGYFIPGVRHLTGLAAGASELEYPLFALFAYSGAIIWTSFFLSVGYFLGHHWTAVVGIGELMVDKIAYIAIALLVLIYILWRKYTNNN